MRYQLTQNLMLTFHEVDIVGHSRHVLIETTGYIEVTKPKGHWVNYGTYTFWHRSLCML